MVISLVHTAHLGPHWLAEVRDLCDLAFDDYDDETFQHALGGTHAMVRHDNVLVAHGAVVLRRLCLGDRWLRCGWIESVATHPAHRGLGYAHKVMAALETLAPAYDLMGLCASEAGRALYESRDWIQWRGPASVLSPDGIRPTPDEDSIYVQTRRPVDFGGPIVCDWREGEVW
jgi:aminoglycoside 2'-N-acetyltransferase I